MTVSPPDDLPDDLDTLAAHVANRLKAAAETRQGPWRTPVLATAAPDGPSARVVVLRTIDPAARRLEIFTDARSAKVAEIAAESRVALTFWDADAAEQLRMAGQARSVIDPVLMERRWQAIGPAGRALYGGDAARFVVLEMRWVAWDWLWVGGDPHRRARFCWGPDGAQGAAWTAL